MKIDTSTTAGKIEVQQAWIDGKDVMKKRFDCSSKSPLDKDCEPLWNWDMYRYSIKPQTVEEAADVYASGLTEAEQNNGFYALKNTGFKAGVQWQKEQDQ